jgi:carbonic anhydrase
MHEITAIAKVAAERIWAELVQGNQRFRTGTPRPRNLIRERQAVARSQRPGAMVITCSDSRVSPEIILDQSLGNLFVVRTAGNVVDAQAIGSLEYAAEHFGPPLLVVIGHEHCGGVEAACSTNSASSPNLKSIIDAVRGSLHVTSYEVEADVLRDAAKENACNVARNVLKSSDILSSRAEHDQLVVITAYYHLESGVLERL